MWHAAPTLGLKPAADGGGGLARRPDQTISGNLAPQIVVESVWACAPDGTLKVTPQQFVAGERAWAVQDRRGTDTVDFERDKAARTRPSKAPALLPAGAVVSCPQALLPLATPPAREFALVATGQASLPCDAWATGAVLVRVPPHLSGRLDAGAARLARTRRLRLC